MTTTSETRAAEQIDLYREVHKGLRLALFDLVTTAGSLAATDDEGVAAFAALFGEIEMMLETHHAHEDGAELGALIDAHTPDAVAAVIRVDHARFDQSLSELRILVAELQAGIDNSASIYDAVTTFTAGYLGHMNVEETEVMPALRDAAPPERLHDIMMTIRASVPPSDMCVFLRYMLPAMNADERTTTLGGMKAGAPPEVFDMFWGVAEESLEPSALATVAERIAA